MSVFESPLIYTLTHWKGIQSVQYGRGVIEQPERNKVSELPNALIRKTYTKRTSKGETHSCQNRRPVVTRYLENKKLWLKVLTGTFQIKTA